jgi:hypothetical protein
MATSRSPVAAIPPPSLAKEQKLLVRIKHTAKRLGLAGVGDLAGLIYLVITSRLLTAIRPASLVIKGSSVTAGFSRTSR